mmetsp:Transcript_2615/g.4374  ORF Transcript_2615/g.4374 Transcript_2615/m.4374 type:complete len:243 (+) Transcript_2615:458-1186(+)
MSSRMNLSTSLEECDLVHCCDCADGRDYDDRDCDCDCGCGGGRRCCRSYRSARAAHCQTPFLPHAAELAVDPSLRILLLISRLLQLLRSSLSLPCQDRQQGVRRRAVSLISNGAAGAGPPACARHLHRHPPPPAANNAATSLGQGQAARPDPRDRSEINNNLPWLRSEPRFPAHWRCDHFCFPALDWPLRVGNAPLCRRRSLRHLPRRCCSSSRTTDWPQTHPEQPPAESTTTKLLDPRKQW